MPVGKATPYLTTDEEVTAAVAAALNVKVAVSAEIDLTATSNSTVLIPANPGFYAFNLASYVLVTSTAGTLSDAPNLECNDGGANKINGGTSSGAWTQAVNTTGAPTQVPINSSTTQFDKACSLASDIIVNVFAAATGTGLTLRGKVITAYMLVAI